MIINAAIKVLLDNRLRSLIDVAVERKVTDLLQEVYTKATTDSHTPVYQIVEQAAVKAIHFGGADNLINDKIDRLAESKKLFQSVTTHLMQLPTFTTPVTCLVKQHAKVAVANEMENNH